MLLDRPDFLTPLNNTTLPLPFFQQSQQFVMMEQTLRLTSKRSVPIYIHPTYMCAYAYLHLKRSQNCSQYS
jgi:hypothetical protein